MQAPSDPAPPDTAGPLAYRTVVAGLAAGQIIAWAILYYAFSSFVLPMMRELGWPKATLMGAFTLALLVWGLANYAAGSAIDRGHGRVVMSAGALLGGAACALWACVEQPWHLYAAFTLAGVSMAMTLYEPAFNIVTKRYPARYREAILTLTLVAGFASTLSFPAAAALIAALGWRDALWVLAAVLTLAVAPLHAWVLQGPAHAAAPRRPDLAADATLRSALRLPAFWLLTFAFTLQAFAGAGLWAHVMPALGAKGLSEAQAVAVLVWIGPAQVAGRFLYAWGGRGLSLHRLGVLVMVAMPLALVLFAVGRDMAVLLAFAAVFGLANGLVTIVRGALVPEYFGRAHLGRIGGTMSAVSLLARAGAPVAIAAALLAVPGYTEVMLALGGLCVAGAVAFALARPPRSAA